MPSRPESVRTRTAPACEGPFEVTPFTETCAGLLTRGDHALIGVSAGNSYFSQERLTRLMRWAGRRFDRVDVLHTDLQLDTMHRAEGADEEQAARRTKRSLRDVRRRIRRAMEAVGDDVPVLPRSLALSETIGLPGYRAVQERLDQELLDNPRVRGACEEHVTRLLGGGGPGEARFEAGLAYLRAELPFLLATPAVLEVPSSVCCYHDLLPVVEELHDEGSCFHPGQGHVVVRPLPIPEPTGGDA